MSYNAVEVMVRRAAKKMCRIPQKHPGHRKRAYGAPRMCDFSPAFRAGLTSFAPAALAGEEKKKMEFMVHSMTDDAFVLAFEKCELPAEAFRHREHLRLSFIYLRRHGFDGARVRISEVIRRYALHNGAAQKYHETITIAWLRIVQGAMANVPAGASFEDMLRAFPELLNKGVLMEFYSSELLATDRARGAFVEPDRKSLPASVRCAPTRCC